MPSLCLQGQTVEGDGSSRETSLISGGLGCRLLKVCFYNLSFFRPGQYF